MSAEFYVVTSLSGSLSALGPFLVVQRGVGKSGLNS